MPDIIITPSSGKLEFIDNSTQTIRRHAFTLDHNDGIKLDAPLSAAAVIAPLNVINVTVNNSNVNYPFVLASGSAETGTKTLMMDGSGGTYNPFTNTATIDISGNSATTTLASNSTNLGGVAAASYVTLTGTQTLTNKTITGTFTGNLTGTGSWATNAVNANTATNSTQLNGQSDSYYTNIPARLGYTPVNKAGDTISGNLTVNGTITENSSIKLKENVETSEGDLEKVVNLRPVTYNKIGSQTTELGLIAEEVAEVYPEFVQYDENGEPIGVHYSRLTAALIGAVKELTNQVQELNKKING